MVMLEKRFYPRQEIAEIVGIADLHDGHFAEKVKRYLNNRGYGYDYSRNGVTISRMPQTAEEQLVFLMRDELKLNKQRDAYLFSCFIHAFSVIGSFESMPWASRTAFFNQHYQSNVQQVTLQRWMRFLIESGNAVRFKKGALWRTVKDEYGDKVQVRVDPNTDEYREYCGKRSALLVDFDKADKQTRSKMWETMLHRLYHAVEFEQASAALQAHLPGALVDFAVRERDDGRYEWDLFFVLDGQLGEAEILEGDFSIRRVRLYDMPEGGLTALQAIAVLAQEKGELLITDLELDLDDGRLRYEGEAMLGERHYEFEISATGSIIEWEYD